MCFFPAAGPTSPSHRRHWPVWIILVIAVGGAGVNAQSHDATGQGQDLVVTRDVLCPGRITNRQCGQFIEYLCNLVPGMWAEKLYDGGFEGLSPYKVAFIRQTDFRERPWYPGGAVNRAKYSLDPEQRVGGATSQKIEVPPGPACTVAICQGGISVEKDQSYDLSIYLRQIGTVGPVEVRLHHDATTDASCTFQPDGQWKRFQAVLKPGQSEEDATLSVSFRGPGTLWLDNASLMPRETEAGWRPDVVRALRELHSGVIRFGGSALDDPNLGDFEWRDTIGDVNHRRPFRAWGGLQPTGPGLEELVQLMQAAGAESLICVRVRQRTPRDAAEEVQYFNGSSQTPMGRIRAENGHPAPYHVRYWQIGNEQGGVDYERNLPAFCQAMKEADPQIELLSSYPSAGVLREASRWISYVCPHQYDCSNLAATAGELDRVRALLRESPVSQHIHVAVTEWNTTGGDWGLGRARLWSLENALACARYQNLLHRNCDLVEIACRSNLCNSFCSGIIQTDNRRLYTTPTYFMQRLYATMAGERPLKLRPAFSVDAVPDCSATLSGDGKVVTFFAVNWTTSAASRTIDFTAFGPAEQDIPVWTLADTRGAGEPDVTNSFAEPQRVAPVRRTVRAAAARLSYRFPALSLTVLRWELTPRDRI